MATRALRIAVIADMDGFANSTKPLLIKNLLSERGHDVRIIDTRHLSRAAVHGPLRALPSPRPRGLLLYLLGLFFRGLDNLPRRLGAPFHSYLYVLQMKLRGQLLRKLICSARSSDNSEAGAAAPFDVVICESQLDSALMLQDLGSITKIYNCSTPLADELYFGGMLTHSGYRRVRNLEIRTFSASDYLSFHWHSYAEYVRKYYGYRVPNIFTFDRIAKVAESPARFRTPPRVVYLGALGGYWIDLHLLSELSARYPHIDVYGLPRPPSELRLNYKGYASADVLRDYQFGLITSSKDRLRREGFSAKHIDYLAAGLPVLAPEWRTSTADLKGTISYTPESFVDLILAYSSEDTWAAAAKAAIDQAAEYSIEKATGEFLAIVENVAGTSCVSQHTVTASS